MGPNDGDAEELMKDALAWKREEARAANRASTRDSHGSQARAQPRDNDRSYLGAPRVPAPRQDDPYSRGGTYAERTYGRGGDSHGGARYSGNAAARRYVG